MPRKMTATRLREKLQPVLDAIKAFDEQTNEDEYTDVCEAWDLLHFAEERLEEVLANKVKGAKS